MRSCRWLFAQSWASPCRGSWWLLEQSRRLARRLAAGWKEKRALCSTSSRNKLDYRGDEAAEAFALARGAEVGFAVDGSSLEDGRYQTEDGASLASLVGRGAEALACAEVAEVSCVALAGSSLDDGRRAEALALAEDAEVSREALAGSSLEDDGKADEPVAEATPLAELDMSEQPFFSSQNMRILRFNHNASGSRMIQQLNIGPEQLRIARQHVSSSSNSGPPIPNLVNLSDTEHYFVEVPAIIRALSRRKGKGKNKNKGKGKAKGAGKPGRGH